jgi:hypothetical protein
MAAIRRRFFVECDSSGREKLIHHSQQYFGDILAANRALYNASTRTTQLNPGDGWRHVASIPLGVVEGWGKQGAWIWRPDDWQIIRRMLNDSEWSALRTAPGRL